MLSNWLILEATLAIFRCCNRRKIKLQSSYLVTLLTIELCFFIILGTSKFFKLLKYIGIQRLPKKITSTALFIFSFFNFFLARKKLIFSLTYWSVVAPVVLNGVCRRSVTDIINLFCSQWCAPRVRFAFVVSYETFNMWPTIKLCLLNLYLREWCL